MHIPFNAIFISAFVGTSQRGKAYVHNVTSVAAKTMWDILHNACAHFQKKGLGKMFNCPSCFIQGCLKQIYPCFRHQT